MSKEGPQPNVDERRDLGLRDLETQTEKDPLLGVVNETEMELIACLGQDISEDILRSARLAIGSKRQILDLRNTIPDDPPAIRAEDVPRRRSGYIDWEVLSGVRETRQQLVQETGTERDEISSKIGKSRELSQESTEQLKESLEESFSRLTEMKLAFGRTIEETPDALQQISDTKQALEKVWRASVVLPEELGTGRQLLGTKLTDLEAMAMLVLPSLDTSFSHDGGSIFRTISREALILSEADDVEGNAERTGDKLHVRMRTFRERVTRKASEMKGKADQTVDEFASQLEDGDLDKVFLDAIRDWTYVRYGRDHRLGDFTVGQLTTYLFDRYKRQTAKAADRGLFIKTEGKPSNARFGPLSSFVAMWLADVNVGKWCDGKGQLIAHDTMPQQQKAYKDGRRTLPVGLTQVGVGSFKKEIRRLCRIASSPDRDAIVNMRRTREDHNQTPYIVSWFNYILREIPEDATPEDIEAFIEKVTEPLPEMQELPENSTALVS